MIAALVAAAVVAVLRAAGPEPAPAPGVDPAGAASTARLRAGDDDPALVRDLELLERLELLEHLELFDSGER